MSLREAIPDKRFIIKRWQRRGWWGAVVVDLYDKMASQKVTCKSKEVREREIDRTIKVFSEKEIDLGEIYDNAIRYAEMRDDYIANNTNSREEAEWEVR